MKKITQEQLFNFLKNDTIEEISTYLVDYINNERPMEILISGIIENNEENLEE